MVERSMTADHAGTLHGRDVWIPVFAAGVLVFWLVIDVCGDAVDNVPQVCREPWQAYVAPVWPVVSL